MIINTHKLASKDFVGNVIKVGDGYSEVSLKVRKEMVVDEYGLVHGGFTFGLADYAAMLAVNKTNVVLSEAYVKFIRPVKIGDTLYAKGEVVKSLDKRRVVYVEVFNQDNKKVFEGIFYCPILDRHVLEKD